MTVSRPPGSPRASRQTYPRQLARGGGLAADGQVLLQLRVEPGDSVRIGTTRLEVLGEIRDVPVDLELQWAVGPPVFVSLDDVEAAGVLTFGSLARYRAWVALPAGSDIRGFVRTYRGPLRA